MIIAGAGGHAKEIAGVLSLAGLAENIYFFDDVSASVPDLLLGKFKILRSEEAARDALRKDPRFIIGVGVPANRLKLSNKFKAWNGKLTSVISTAANVGTFDVRLAAGLNIMPGALITEEVQIGEGTLVHAYASVHHNVTVGDYCELLPGCRILGHATIGNHCSIGSGAVVLPRITIGNNVVVGAGAVVTRDIADGAKVKGVPAK
jgi:sugar O-acyltransferase (sialic acid O-acetyltransferase NeuD family)